MDDHQTMRRIDDAVTDLEAIVDRARTESSYLGVFPAMYLAVTVEVRRGMKEGLFDDASQLERLVVTFADLYLAAFESHRRGDEPSRSWALAFGAAESRRRRSILQHLLLGMNAHINLDLGIATATIAPNGKLPPVYADFIRVNEVLFSLIDDLQDCLNRVSPWMGLVDRAGRRFDEGFMRVGLRACRDRAWHFAETLVGLDEAERADRIRERDEDVRRLGHLVGHRLSVVHMANALVRMRETRDVALVLDAFTDRTIDLDRVWERAARELSGEGPHRVT